MNVFSIAPARVGGLDLLIPIFLEIKRQRPRIKIEVLFFESKAYEDLRKNAFLWNEFRRVVDRTVHLRKDPAGRGRLTGYASRFGQGFRVLPALLRMMISPGSVLLHSRDLESQLMRILHGANRMNGGRTLRHPNSMVLSRDRLSNPGKGSDAGGDAYLYFGQHDVPFLEAQGDRRAVPIGYPRLYGSWIRRIREVAHGYVGAELARYRRSPDQTLVSLFAGSTEEGVFGTDEFEGWLEGAVGAVRRCLPEAFLFIKPHPMQNMDHLTAVLDRLGEPPVGITHLHAGVLASRSRVVIAHHSGTILDAMAMGAPTIQFQDFTPHWMRAHPERSGYLKLGLLHAGSEPELYPCIEQALSPSYAPPDLSETLGHREDLSVFWGEQ